VREPDPGGRIERDNGRLVMVDTTVVPDTRAKEVSNRVHVVLRPGSADKAHWNNEAGNLVFWVSPPAGWNVSQNLTTVPNPPQAASTEPRHVEFEVRAPNGATPNQSRCPRTLCIMYAKT